MFVEFNIDHIFFDKKMLRYSFKNPLLSKNFLMHDLLSIITIFYLLSTIFH